jgi:hypothetical protein
MGNQASPGPVSDAQLIPFEASPSTPDIPCPTHRLGSVQKEITTKQVHSFFISTTKSFDPSLAVPPAPPG